MPHLISIYAQQLLRRETDINETKEAFSSVKRFMIAAPPSEHGKLLSM